MARTSPEAKERHARKMRERRAQQRAEALAAADLARDREPESHPQESRSTEPARSRRSSSADGKIIGVVGFPRPGNRDFGYPTSSEVLYDATRGADMPSAYGDLGTYLATPRAAPDLPCAVYLPTASRTFFPADGPGEIARVAEWIAESLDLPDTEQNDLRADLSRLRPGDTLDLRKSDPSTNKETS